MLNTYRIFIKFIELTLQFDLILEHYYKLIPILLYGIKSDINVLFFNTTKIYIEFQRFVSPRQLFYLHRCFASEVKKKKMNAR